MKQAASLMMLRRLKGPGRRYETYWVKRHAGSRFLSDYHAFPGGMLDPGESPELGAIRETFEETGYLLAGGAKTGHVALRQALRSGEANFGTECSKRGLQPRLGKLKSLGSVPSPDYLVDRFETHYFSAVVDASANPQVDEDDPELSEGEWITPKDALAAWEASTVLLAPPTLELLRRLADGTLPLDSDATYVCSPVRPGVTLFPLRTETLPPATHTNCYIFGHQQLAVVDPAATDPVERARLDAWLDGRVARGAKVCAVLLTHHHPDHMGGARHLADRFDAPLMAHPLTAALLDGQVDSTLEEGAVVDLGTMQLDCLHTPGHAPGHLCFIEREHKTAAVGDMVAGVGSILIEPGDGDMAVYLEQLARLRDLKFSALLPAHGPVIGAASTYLGQYIEHRLEREGLVLGALSAAPSTVSALVELAYADVPQPVREAGIAGLSLVAHLLKLEAEGRAQRHGEQWSLPG